jgi:hypothetical protein
MEPRITNAHEVGDVWRVREVAEAGRRLDRMGPLVHELIAWDLVVRTESGTFVLSDDVQRRLQETSARQWTSTPEVYVGRTCHRCGASGVTRMVGEARLCDACSRASVAEVEPEHRPSRRHGRHDGRSWWGHKAG